MNPLEQLADINPPSNVAWWPLAWGYWVLIILVVCLLAASIYAYVKYRDKRAVKRESLAAIHLIAIDDPYYAHKIQVILKRTCSYYFPNALPAQLSGDEWRAFLSDNYAGKSLADVSEFTEQIQHTLYQAPNSEQSLASNTSRNAALASSVTSWIKHSVPPKQTSGKRVNHSSEAAHV